MGIPTMPHVWLNKLNDADDLERERMFAAQQAEKEALEQKVLDDTFPEDAALPPFREAVNDLANNLQIQKDAAFLALLSSASFACQSFIDVLPFHKRVPVPACVFTMTVGESGSGKSMMNDWLDPPFKAFATKMTVLAKQRELKQKAKLSVWKKIQSSLEKKAQRAFEDGDDEGYEAALQKAEENAQKKPPESGIIKPFLEDVSHIALAERLNDFPEVAIRTDEGLAFMHNSSKNQAILNNAWDGGACSVDRSENKVYDFKPVITMDLKVQPNVLEAFMKKGEGVSRGSGFLSRFMITVINHRLEQFESRVLGSPMYAMEAFQKLLTAHLDKLSHRIAEEQTDKITIELTEEAKALCQKRWEEILQETAPGGKYHDIKDFAKKSLEIAVRIAAIMQYFWNEDVSPISEKLMANALRIENWYLQRTFELFYPSSPDGIFELRVRELYVWCRTYNDGQPFEKRRIRQSAPRRLRNSPDFELYLEQLFSQEDLVCARGYNKGKLTQYITWPVRPHSDIPQNRYADIPDCTVTDYTYRGPSNTRGHLPHVDVSDLRKKFEHQ